MLRLLETLGAAVEHLLTYLDAVRGSIGVAILLTAPLVLLEMAAPREAYPLRSRLRGVVFTLLGVLIATALNMALNAAWSRIGVTPLVRLELLGWFAWSGPLKWVFAVAVVILVNDLVGYWFHRLQHGPLWPLHAVHHSIEEMHAVNSFGHPADGIFNFIFLSIPLSLLAFGPADSLTLALILTLQLKFIHCPVKLNFGPFRCVLADNNYHRIHHSVEERHFHKNYGTLTTVWDRVFGTAYFPAKDEWPATGLAEIREPRNVREWLDFPLRYRRPKDCLDGESPRFI